MYMYIYIYTYIYEVACSRLLVGAACRTSPAIQRCMEWRGLPAAGRINSFPTAPTKQEENQRVVASHSRALDGWTHYPVLCTSHSVSGTGRHERVVRSGRRPRRRL